MNMNMNLRTFTKEEVEGIKFRELPSVYNLFARELGIRKIKHFRTKHDGQESVLRIQSEYLEEVQDLITGTNTTAYIAKLLLDNSDTV